MLLLRIRLILILIQKFIDVHTIVHNGTFIVYIRTRIQPHVNSECINSIYQLFCMINSDKGYRNLILVNYFAVLLLFWILTHISNVHRFGVGAGLAHFFFFLPTQLDPDPQQPNNTSKKWNAACGRMKHGVLVPEFPEVLAPSSQTSEELYSMSSVTWPLSTIFRPNTPLSPGFYNITYRYTKLVRSLLPTLYAVPI